MHEFLDTNVLTCPADSKGIDDYLMTHEHEESYIEEFLANLDLPIVMSPPALDQNTSTVCSPAAPMPALSKQSHDTILRERLKQTTEASCHLVETPHAVQHLNFIRIGTGLKRPEGFHTDIKNNIQPKKRNLQQPKKAQLPEETPGERRRQQNREAQRRYRERQMLETYRRLRESFY
jgi:hypothetical protein